MSHSSAKLTVVPGAVANCNVRSASVMPLSCADEPDPGHPDT